MESSFDRWLTTEPSWRTEGPCEPCSLGNHTGTNGTTGCEGEDCACACREGDDQPGNGARQPSSRSAHGRGLSLESGWDDAWERGTATL